MQIIGFLKGPLKGDFLGMAVAPAGDVNQDGYADFLAGAVREQAGLPVGVGRTYLYYGGPGIVDTVPDVTFPLPGDPLVNLGDINGDGLPDYALWPGDSLSVRVYYGGNPPDTVPDLIFSPEFPRDLLGFQVASGDVNGANGRDLLISAPHYPNDDLFINGRVYLYNNNGLVGIDTTADWMVTGAGLAQNKLTLGVGSIIITDFNGDGFADILAGEPGTSNNNTPGSIHIFLGKSNPLTIPDTTFRQPDWAFGTILSAAGDLNGDRYGDFVTLSSGSTGIPFVYFGGPVLDTLPDLSLDHIAFVYASAGDINHDGYQDLLTGDPRGTNFLTGYVYVYFGGPNMDNRADVIIDEADLPIPAPDFGQALAGVGDVNGDGVDDFIVGAEEGIADSTDRGQVWVFAGDSDLISTDVEEIPSPRPIFESRLEQNYPNPFNSQATIEYDLKAPRPLPVRLVIYDLLGRTVRILVNETQRTGRYRVTWDGKDESGRNVASGVYLYQLRAGNYSETKKLVLIK
ncbi:MAG: FG-GAP-like repeat-containing protein [candidate division Zixibacteria bacterium]|nr:FG-GAP-like repeat-containing protein [candidate division Zixibacteria bacterium]